MKRIVSIAVACLLCVATSEARAQQPTLERLPPELLDVVPPSARVNGTLGSMVVQRGGCREMPGASIRRRIVDIAVQEWSFFGFPILDRINGRRLMPPGLTGGPGTLGFAPGSAGRVRTLDPMEAARVASSIAGYWAVTPDGPGVVADQNRAWNGNGGPGARWVAPWSAAFISWVMCEAGLGRSELFPLAVAHWVYIDHAIRARDGRAPHAAFVAYEIGERAVEPGDLLCASSRPAYRTLAERRRQLGVGARSHCDVVVGVDLPNERILTVGGNVLRSVSLKVFPAAPDTDGGLHPARSGNQLFAHLKLRADPIEANALAGSPTFATLLCAFTSSPVRTAFVATALGLTDPAGRRC